jgi:hypothetical protein
VLVYKRLLYFEGLCGFGIYVKNSISFCFESMHIYIHIFLIIDIFIHIYRSMHILQAHVIFRAIIVLECISKIEKNNFN